MRELHFIQTSRDLIKRLFHMLLVGLLIGSASALSALAMVELIHYGSVLIAGYKSAHPGLIKTLTTVLVPAAGGLMVGFIVSHMSNQRPQTPADVILAAQSRLKLATLRLRDGVLNFIASIISLASGASLGQYGPIVTMGATFGAGLQKIMRTEHNVLIGCGVAAAISSAFSAPIAGVVFAHEVILRHYSLRAFAPITIAAAIAFYLSKFVFGMEHLFQLEEIQILHFEEFAGFTAIGIAAGLLTVLYLHTMLYARVLSSRIPVAQKYKPMIAGLGLGLLALQVPEVLGIGEAVMRDTLYASLPSVETVSLLLVAKILATALCFGFGFAGGVFSPSLLIGVLFGSLFGLAIDQLFPGTSITEYAVCGMAAVTSPLIGAPLATILIIFELTHNYELTTAVMISVVFSNVITYRLFGRSLFDFQLKSRGHDLNQGRDPLILSTMSVASISHRACTRIKPDISIANAINQMVNDGSNEAFVVDHQQLFIGTTSLATLLNYKQDEKTLNEMDQAINLHNLRFSPATSIWEAMRDIKGFTGESIPVVDRENGKLTGVVYQSDLIEAYMRTSRELRSEETANA